MEQHEATHRKPGRRLTALLLLAFVLAACSNDGSLVDDVGSEGDTCIISSDLFADGGVGKDGIPALTNPGLTTADDAGYLTDNSRVIGLVVDGRALAVPHNILWWHEIINLNLTSRRLAVTYCPLTGSSMAFDRASVDGAAFGVSGLLFQNNLTMYDRNTSETLWPQMMAQGGCGQRSGQALPMQAVIEMTWGAWKQLHPGTDVISGETGFGRNYTQSGYPYGNYEDLNNPGLLFSMPIDGQRPPKERVLGIPSADGGIAFPFGVLDDTDAPYRVVHESAGGQPVVVFWSREAQGAMAFRPAEGQAFVVEGGVITDVETGSTWRVTGRAVDGPLAGALLEPVDEAFVAFWFAWAAFNENTRLWTG